MLRHDAVHLVRVVQFLGPRLDLLKHGPDIDTSSLRLRPVRRTCLGLRVRIQLELANLLARSTGLVLLVAL